MGRHGKQLLKSKYPTMAAPGHPLAQKDGRIRVHRWVLYETIGPGEHACNWCGRTIEWGGTRERKLVVDHVNFDTWDNSPDNLVPSCSRCNTGREQRSWTHCINGHEWTDENTRWRKPAREGGKPTRMCRACERERSARYPKAPRKYQYTPLRVALRIPLGGLTLDDVRVFVARTAEVDGSTRVFASHNDESGIENPPERSAQRG